MTIPNLITCLRIILTPIFIIYIINGRFSSALIIFILAALSDAADGLIARLFNQKSSLGAFLDPLADKILLTSAFIVLSIVNYIPSWLTVIVISRDILILFGVLFLLLRENDFTIKPSFLSKITTCLQLMVVFIVLSRKLIPFFSPFTDYLFWITGISTITSGLHYMHFWFWMIGEENHKDR